MAAVKHARSKARRRVKLTPLERQMFKSPLDHAKAYELVWNQVSELFEIARLMRDVSFVYVIGEETDGPIKIGVAKDPVKRLRSMQTGNPRRLRVEHVLLGRTDLEKLLHEMWEPFAIKSLRNRGKVDAAPGTEWFRPEVRERLFPIMATAAEKQIEYVESTKGEIDLDELESRVRQAHGEHGYVATGREPVRLLGAQGGYVIANRRPRV